MADRKSLPKGWVLSGVEVRAARRGDDPEIRELRITRGDETQVFVRVNADGLPPGYAVEGYELTGPKRKTLTRLDVRADARVLEFYLEGHDPTGEDAREERSNEGLYALDTLVGLPPDAPKWERDVFIDRVRSALVALKKQNPEV